jgi:hypothetical protein
LITGSLFSTKAREPSRQANALLDRLFALPARLPLFKERYDAFLDILCLAT